MSDDFRSYITAENKRLDDWFAQSVRDHIAWLVLTLQEVEADHLRFGFQELLDEYQEIFEGLCQRREKQQKEVLAGILASAQESSGKLPDI